MMTMYPMQWAKGLKNAKRPILINKMKLIDSEMLNNESELGMKNQQDTAKIDLNNTLQFSSKYIGWTLGSHFL